MILFLKSNGQKKCNVCRSRGTVETMIPVREIKPSDFYMYISIHKGDIKILPFKNQLIRKVVFN